MSDVWHSTSLFVKSPLYKALFHLKVFLLNTSGFIFIQTSCKWGQYFPWLPSRILGKGLVVDERCQTTLFLFICFLDTAIIRRPPSLSIVETKYRIFYLLAFFSNLAIDSSVDLIFYTIVNCFPFVGVLWSHCHNRREKRIKIIEQFHFGFVNFDWNTLSSMCVQQKSLRLNLFAVNLPWNSSEIRQRYTYWPKLFFVICYEAIEGKIFQVFSKGAAFMVEEFVFSRRRNGLQEARTNITSKLLFIYIRFKEIDSTLLQHKNMFCSTFNNTHKK